MTARSSSRKRGESSGQSRRITGPVWDFRSIVAEEAPWAATYEYARNSTKVLALWAKWQTSSVSVVGRGRVSVKRALADYTGGPLPSIEPDPVADALVFSFPAPLRVLGLDALLLRTPDFPTPWNTIALTDFKGIPHHLAMGQLVRRNRGQVMEGAFELHEHDPIIAAVMM